MKRSWSILVSIYLLCLLAIPACGVIQFRPEYPATFTPVPPSPTRPVVTLGPSLTPSPRPTLPTSTPAPNGLNTAWVANAFDQTLVNVDPLNGIVLQTVQIEGEPKLVRIGEGSIWAIEKIGDNSSNILRIDPISRLVGSRIPITNGEAVSLIVGDGTVWVGVAREFSLNETPGGGVEFSRTGALLMINPQTNQISETIEMDAIPADLVLDGQALWILSKKKSYSYVNKIDLETRIIYTIPEAILSADYIHRFERMAKLDDWLWMTPQDTSAPYLFRVSPVDGIVDASVATGATALHQPVAILAYQNQIWAALRNGSIQIIDPQRKQIEQTIRTPADSLSDLYFMNGYIWAVSSGAALFFQIEPESGEIIASISSGNAPPPTSTPTITPTPNPNLIWALCDEAFPTRLRVGMYARVNQDPPIPNRVRVEPDTESLILGYIQPGERVEILSGPVCQSGWVWWNVISADTGLTGWTSEGDGNDYWLVPVED